MLKYAMKNQQVMKDSNIEYKNKYIYYVFVISILVCHLAISEEADSDKPIEIEADTMTVEETKNTSTYEGDVILTQGSLLINADKLIIREDRKVFNIVLPLVIQQLLDKKWKALMNILKARLFELSTMVIWTKFTCMKKPL